MKASTDHENRRQAIIAQIAAITTMQPGTLSEEWRERPGPQGKSAQRVGPYFKHQVWRDGRNVSRRVPAAEAAQLREDINNAKRYERLTGELADLNIEHTLILRASEAARGESAEGKKDSRPKAARNASPKPKPSSKKPKRA